LRTIRKIAITQMSGVLIIPLWKNAKFCTFGFRDGVHLNAMFENVQLLRMHTLARGIFKEGYNWGKRDTVSWDKDRFRARPSSVRVFARIRRMLQAPVWQRLQCLL
jgi:hypothetical protein